MRNRPSNTSADAGTLVIALLTLAAVTWITAHSLFSITSRLQTAHRSAAWNEALTTAESAVDMTVADLTALLPDVRLNTQEGLTTGVSQLSPSVVSSLNVASNGINLSQGITVSFNPTPLTHGGEGAGYQESTVMLDTLPLSAVLNSQVLDLSNLGGILANPLGTTSGAEPNLVRLRVRGTVGLPGRQQADPESLDTRLRRPTLVWDRVANTLATRASVSRELVVLLKPVLPFQTAVSSGSEVNIGAADAVLDSFNSGSPLTSTDQQYDVTKRLQNGNIHINSSSVNLSAMVYGNVRTSGSNLTKTERISGVVDNGFSQPLPSLREPAWVGDPTVPTSVTASTTLSAGTGATPARYKFDSVTGTLRITRGLLGLDTDVQIWIRGSFTGALVLDPGVRAKVFVEGNVDLAPGDLVNGSQLASSLEIYGIADVEAAQPLMKIALGNVHAAIYAPTHRVEMSGSGDFHGSVTGASFTALGAIRVHYDEALALSAGPVVRYAVASWMERPL